MFSVLTQRPLFVRGKAMWPLCQGIADCTVRTITVDVGVMRYSQSGQCMRILCVWKEGKRWLKDPMVAGGSWIASGGVLGVP